MNFRSLQYPQMDRIGRYRVTAELGRGAVGVVYMAEDPAIGRTVAIKTIQLCDIADPEERMALRDRMFREAQSAGVLSHPGIVTIYDVAEEGGCAYIAMEFVDGPTLDKLPPGSIDTKLVLSVLSQAATALDYAHRRGVVHRDIKPANIILHEGSVTKIADFGVAKIQSQEGVHVGGLMGTPSYMSPEQIRGLDVTGASDQFSLGVIAYELLTGDKPFEGESLASLAVSIVNHEPRPVHEINKTLTWAADTVIRRSLSKDPQARFDTCTGFAEALAKACQSAKGWQPAGAPAMHDMPTLVTQVPQTLMPLDPLPLKGLPSQPDEAPSSPPPFVRVSRMLAAVVLVGGLLVVLLVFGVDYLSERREKGAASPTTEQRPTFAPSSPLAGLDREPEAESIAPRREGPVRVTGGELATRLVTTPPGATVSLDGDSSVSCTTPCELELPSGRHTLSAVMSGYRRTFRIFRVPEDQEVTVALEKAEGMLLINSDPQGAAVRVDGKEFASKTPAVIRLSTGAHTVDVERNGQQESRQVTIEDAVTTTLQVKFDGSRSGN